MFLSVKGLTYFTKISQCLHQIMNPQKQINLNLFCLHLIIN